MDKGYVQVYTGNGKGKTTCAIGQGIRASGAGLRVLMIQFLKSWHTSEVEIIDKIDNFDFMRIGEPRDFTWNLSESEKEELKIDINAKFKRLNHIDMYDMVIFDEILGTINCGFLDEDVVIDFINRKPQGTEIILTGRDASQKIIDKADLVTEMREIKHYYTRGVRERKGIEF